MRWLLVFLFFLSGCGPEVDLGDAVLVPGTDMVCAYGSPGASISISPDGEWLVFIESILLHAEYTKKYPGRGNVLPPRNRLSSINLTTGEKTEHAMPDGTPADQHMIIVTMFSPSGWRDGKFYSHTAPKNNMEVVVDPHKRIVDLERGASKLSCSDCSANTQSNRIYLDDPPDYPFQDRTIFDERVSPDRKYLAYVLGVAIRNVLALNHRGQIYIMDLETKEKHQVFRISDWSNLAWSSDSKRLYFGAETRYFRSNRENCGIYYVDVDKVFKD